MADLEKLAMKQAHWARVKREATRRGSDAASLCHFRGDEVGSLNCIERIYQLVGEDYEGCTFDGLWNDEVLENGVCDRCVEVRRLKRVRAHAGRRLGQIRAAITKAGEHLIDRRVSRKTAEADVGRVIDRIAEEVC